VSRTRRISSTESSRMPNRSLLLSPIAHLQTEPYLLSAVPAA
jgi:hypothetical protein